MAGQYQGNLDVLGNLLITGALNIGTGIAGASRTISAQGSASNVNLILSPQGTGTIQTNSAYDLLISADIDIPNLAYLGKHVMRKNASANLQSPGAGQDQYAIVWVNATPGFDLVPLSSGTSNNGITKTSNNFALGGSLVANTFIDGAFALDFGLTTQLTEFYVHSTTDNSLFNTQSGVTMAITQNSSGLSLISTSSFVISLTGAITLTDAGIGSAQRGLRGGADYSGNVVANDYVQKVYVDKTFLSKPISTILTSPGSGQNGYAVTWDNVATQFTLSPSGGGGGGSASFIGLTDVPADYSGAALKLVRVNASANGLQFVDPGNGNGTSWNHTNTTFDLGGILSATSTLIKTSQTVYPQNIRIGEQGLNYLITGAGVTALGTENAYIDIINGDNITSSGAGSTGKIRLYVSTANSLTDPTNLYSIEFALNTPGNISGGILINTTNATLGAIIGYGNVNGTTYHGGGADFVDGSYVNSSIATLSSIYMPIAGVTTAVTLGPIFSSNSYSTNLQTTAYGGSTTLNRAGLYVAGVISSGNRGIIEVSGANTSTPVQPTIKFLLQYTPSNSIPVGFVGVLNTKGIQMIDQQDSTGLFYAGDYHTSGISTYGNRWIPDKGYNDSVYLVGSTYNVQSGNYTFVAGDANIKVLQTTGTSGTQTLTIPPHSSVAWNTNDILTIVWDGVAVPSLAAGAGVTINSSAGSGILTIPTQYSFVTVIYRGSDVWYLENGVGNSSNGWLVTGTTTLTGNTTQQGAFINTFNLNGVTLTQQTQVATSPTNAFLVTAAPHTNITASTEYIDIYLNLGRTVQFATGNITLQRGMRIAAPTYGAVGSSTFTEAATLYIDNSPQVGSNVTITSPYALYIGAGNSKFNGNILINGTPSSANSPIQFQFNAGSVTGGNPIAVQLSTFATATGLTNAENQDIVFGLSVSKTFLGSATPGAANIALQRSFYISAGASYAFGNTGAQIITDAATLYILSAPKPGTNATITNSHVILIPTTNISGGSGVTNGYGLTINAPSGATNNFAAQFIGAVDMHGGLGTGIQTISSNPTFVFGTDYTYLCDTTSGSITVTLPSASTWVRRILVFKKIVAGNSLIINTPADGAKTFTTQWTGCSVQSNGTSWYVIASF